MFLITPNSSSFSEAKIGLKLCREDYHKESVIVLVTLTGKGEWKVVQHEDNIHLSVSFSGCYIKFQVTAFVYSYRASSKVHSSRLSLHIRHTAYQLYSL